MLENAVSVATVIPTPTITRNQDIVYMTGSSKLVINGTNFREKAMELVFEPPLERNKDYILSVIVREPLSLGCSVGGSRTPCGLVRMLASTSPGDRSPRKIT